MPMTPTVPLIDDDDFVKLFQTRAKMHGLFDGTPLGNPGPITLAALDRILPNLSPEVAKVPPWISVGLEVLGLHEVRDNVALGKFLKRDGKTLGDPAKLPWCGDFVETCIRLGLPSEPLPGPLAENPYWARNWAGFGRKLSQPCRYSVVSFTRDGGGHVGFAVGQDTTCYHVFGGNQGNTVSVVRIEKSRLLAACWPTTWTGTMPPLPVKAPGDLPVSKNEF